MAENYDKFWREMNDKASFKDFYKEPRDEKSGNDLKLLCELLGDATVLDADENGTITISCHEWRWDEWLKLTCLCHSPDNAKKLASVLQAIARNNRREVDIHKPPMEAHK